MARGMATVAVNGTPAEDDSPSTPVGGISSPSAGADPDHGRTGEPTAPLAAQEPGTDAVTTSAPAATEATPSDRRRPRPRPRPRAGSSSAAKATAAADVAEDPAATVQALPAATVRPPVVPAVTFTAPVVPAARTSGPSGPAAAPVAPAAAADDTQDDGGPTSWGAPASSSTSVDPVDPEEAEEFLRLFYAEADEPGAATVKGAAGRTAPFEDRVAEVRDEIERTGTYVHTSAELTFGARVAWRSSARCIGRLYWRSLHVRDRRHVLAPDEVAAECVGHLDEATRRGRDPLDDHRVRARTPRPHRARGSERAAHPLRGLPHRRRVAGRPAATSSSPTTPARSAGSRPRRWGGSTCSRWWSRRRRLGRAGPAALRGAAGRRSSRSSWPTPTTRGSPNSACAGTRCRRSATCRWRSAASATRPRPSTAGTWAPRSAPATSPTPTATTCWPRSPGGSAWTPRTERTLWRDRALVELNLAVQHSFDEAGVTMADHHTESQRFLRTSPRGEAPGGAAPADWSWIVPPVSGGLTPVFHRYYTEPTDTGPMFRMDPLQAARGQGCPV